MRIADGMEREGSVTWVTRGARHSAPLPRARCAVSSALLTISICLARRLDGGGLDLESTHHLRLPSKFTAFPGFLLLFELSGRSNDYSKNTSNSSWKAVLLNKVVVGKGYKMLRDSPLMTGPPSGYDSVSTLISLCRASSSLFCLGVG